MTDPRSSCPEEASREWFEDWFNHPLYLQVYSHRDAAEAALCVETILRLTSLDHAPAGISVLDIACGAGRHAFEFARKGMLVTANDLSRFLLETATDEACKQGLCIEFSGCDMRTLQLERHYDLVVQLFSSFGYFATDQEDRRVVSNVASMLKPDGWYVLDIINPPWLREHFVPNSEKTVGTLSITEERELSENKVVKKIRIRDRENRELTFTESVRLFSPEEISGLLESEGFSIDRMAGDYQGNRFDSGASSRMLIFARKRRL